MGEILEALKSAYGGYGFPILYGICLIALFVLSGENRKRLALPAALITVVVLNPLFYRVWARLNEAQVYWRTLWMIPILPVCAAVVAMLADRAKRLWLKAATIALGIAVVILCGGYVYTNTYPPAAFQPTTRAEKLSEDVVRTGEALLELEEHPRVVADTALSVYLRQYSGRIQSPYARSVTYGVPSALGRTMYDDLAQGDYAALAQAMVNHDYDYLVTTNLEPEKLAALDAAGFELVRDLNPYGIYRAHCDRTERRVYNDLGQTTSVTQLDENGDPVNGSDGCATVSYEYDDHGYVSREFHTDADGKGVADSVGTAGYRCERNYRGWMLSQTWLDAEGNPTDRADTHYATVERRYDRGGNVTEETYFDAQGNAVSYSAE